MTELLKPRDLAMWRDARPYLDVRNNDEHTIVAYGVACQLLELIPEADERIVLPAILLHDVGWKMIPQDLLLAAVGKDPSRPDLVREHEIQGVKIAEKILRKHAPEGTDIEAVLAIIDGHDTTTEARSLNDAVVKDADKVWRTTRHGMRVISAWYDWSPEEYLAMVNKVSNPRLLTPEGRAMGFGFTAALAAEIQAKKYLEGTQ